jgi:hypothetical protein
VKPAGYNLPVADQATVAVPVFLIVVAKQKFLKFVTDNTSSGEATIFL